MFLPLGFMAPHASANANPLPTISGHYLALDASQSLGVPQFYSDLAATTPWSGSGGIRGFRSLSDSNLGLSGQGDNNGPGRSITKAGTSLYGLDFDGTQQLYWNSGAGSDNALSLFQGNPTGNPSALTILAVVCPPPSGGPYSLVCAGASNTTDAILLDTTFFPAGDQYGNNIYFGRHSPAAAGGGVTRATFVGTPATISLSNGASAPLYKVVFGFTNNTTAPSLWVSGFSEIYGSPSNAGSDQTAWQYFNIGAFYNGSSNYQFWQGLIFELHIWNTAATVAQRQALLQYATNKWG